MSRFVPWILLWCAALGSILVAASAPYRHAASKSTLAEVRACGATVGYVYVVDGDVRSMLVLAEEGRRAAQVLHDAGTLEYGKIEFPCVKP